MPQILNSPLKTIHFSSVKCELVDLPTLNFLFRWRRKSLSIERRLKFLTSTLHKLVERGPLSAIIRKTFLSKSNGFLFRVNEKWVKALTNTEKFQLKWRWAKAERFLPQPYCYCKETAWIVWDFFKIILALSQKLRRDSTF